jgi:hypothetical protein
MKDQHNLNQRDKSDFRMIFRELAGLNSLIPLSFLIEDFR